MLAVLTKEETSMNIKGTELLTALHDSCMMRKLNRFSPFSLCFRHELHYFTSVNWALRDFLTPRSPFDFRSVRKGSAVVGPSSGLEGRANVASNAHGRALSTALGVVDLICAPNSYYMLIFTHLD
uniref:Poly (ADP ribose) polymerase n=1 Tax=Echinococcus granulosus TaxID=6210 RepID=A0A068X1R5_ECHGR|nr:poly (ADP ribose) polymerase [Echinococcus granulosus]